MPEGDRMKESDLLAIIVRIAQEAEKHGDVKVEDISISSEHCRFTLVIHPFI